VMALGTVALGTAAWACVPGDPGTAPPPAAAPGSPAPAASADATVGGGAGSLGLAVAGGALVLSGVAAGSVIERRRRSHGRATPATAPSAAPPAAQVTPAPPLWARTEPAAVVLLAGAGLFALARPGLGRVVGLLAAVVLAAGVVGRIRHLIPVGTVLAGWGAAILLVAEDVLPARSAPVEIIGIALGTLVALGLAGSERERAAWFRTASLTALNAGLTYYLAYDHGVFVRWQWWAITLVAWAAWVQVAGARARQRASVPAGATASALPAAAGSAPNA